MSIREEIIQAAFEGDTETLNSILQINNVNLNSITNQFGAPLLHVAAAAGHTEVVLELIGRYNLDVNAENADGATALDIAYTHRDAQMAIALRDHGGHARLAAAPARNIVFNNLVNGYWDNAEETHEWSEYHVQRGPIVMGEVPILCNYDGDVY